MTPPVLDLDAMRATAEAARGPNCDARYVSLPECVWPQCQCAQPDKPKIKVEFYREDVLAVLDRLRDAEAEREGTHNRILPSVDEALAYADGYAEGLADADQKDVAALITERAALVGKFGLEKVLRQSFERQVAQLRAEVVCKTEELARLRARAEKAEARVAELEGRGR